VLVISVLERRGEIGLCCALGAGQDSAADQESDQCADRSYDEASPP
jgi:hypothetical protein